MGALRVQLAAAKIWSDDDDTASATLNRNHTRVKGCSSSYLAARGRVVSQPCRKERMSLGRLGSAAHTSTTLPPSPS